jgi:hypothetical protein
MPSPMCSDFHMKLHVPAPSLHINTGDDSRCVAACLLVPVAYHKAFLHAHLLPLFFITPPTTSFEHPQQSNQSTHSTHSFNQALTTTTKQHQPPLPSCLTPTARISTTVRSTTLLNACKLPLTSLAEVGDHITPDNSKSTTEKVKDTVTGAGDKVQRYAPSLPPLPPLTPS